jgi:hypothetical protein
MIATYILKWVQFFVAVMGLELKAFCFLDRQSTTWAIFLDKCHKFSKIVLYGSMLVDIQIKILTKKRDKGLLFLQYFIPPLQNSNQIYYNNKGVSIIHSLVMLNLWLFLCSDFGLMGYN